MQVPMTPEEITKKKRQDAMARAREARKLKQESKHTQINTDEKWFTLFNTMLINREAKSQKDVETVITVTDLIYQDLKNKGKI